MKRDNNIEESLHNIRLEKNIDFDEAIAFLYNSGCTIVETMKIIVAEYNISLAQAKNMVVSHPCWKAIVDATEPLHEELEQHVSDN